ncbi:histidinol-phosphate aminotransferase family protein [Metallosphaera tengchongensis]|uniref:Aminotransferase n=1 Tax=Metallosphaera tengchongensis TaxID=1532350 RepID=A0A6N0NYW0_9CREN|nr:histidinol-phosphate transaminase [Metallosphaera tengchongensis]QKR01003.1 histidinol-phosphate aminotransferase family protein [Metallosphaera tengchongensis]
MMHGGLSWGNGKPSPIKDFSVNLNPVGVPKFLEEILEESMRRKVYLYYPDDYLTLKRNIAEIYDVDYDLVGVFNGASEAISRLDRALSVPEPNYQEYPRGSIYLASEGSEEFYFPLQGSSVIASHPNNPTGSPLRKEEVVNFLEAGKELIVDQSFADISPVDSFIPLVRDFPSLLVVSSFTKSFSIPGLRIGFTIGKKSKLLERASPPWRVNSIAYYIFANVDPKEVRRFFNYSKEKTKENLDKISRYGTRLKFYRSYAPFVLAEATIPTANLNRELLRRGYYVRDCSNFVGLRSNHFRFSLSNNFIELLKQIEEILVG